MNSIPRTRKNLAWGTAHILALLLCMAAVALACGMFPSGEESEPSATSAPSAPSDPDQLILNDVTMALEMDYRAILEMSELPLPGLIAVLNEYQGVEDASDLHDRMRDEWDDADFALATDMEDVETFLSITVLSEGYGYVVVEGAFDFGDIESELEDRDFEEDTYRSQLIWEHGSGDSVALFEEVGIYVYGEEDAVKDVLKGIALGEGFLDGEADLRRAMGASGKGLIRLVMDCDALATFSPASLSAVVGRLDDGCEGVSIVVVGGDADETEAGIGYVYRSEGRAESALDDIEESIEDSDYIDADVDAIEVSGDVVTVELTVYTESSGRGLAVPAPAPSPAQASEGTRESRLDMVRSRDKVICASRNDVPGYGYLDESGNNVGFDIDLCRALAAAVLGDPNKIEIRLITAAERGPTIQSGEVDMLVRTVTWTTSRDSQWGNYAQTMFYDGQGFLVRKGLGISSALELRDASVCVTQGTTTELNLQDFSNQNNLNISPLTFEDTDAVVAAYEAEQCDAFTNDRSQLAALSTALEDPSAHTILPETISEEPLGPVVPHGDDQWFDIVKTTMGILIYAEAYGVGQASVPSSKTGDTKVDRLFGLEGSFGQESLGISQTAAQNVIRAVGNYGEIYARNLGPSGINLPRTDGDRNALWSAAPCSDCPKGGQIYAPIFRPVWIGGAGQHRPAPKMSRLDEVRSRDKVICASRNDVPGFGYLDNAGFDIDLCRAVAAAVLGDPNKIEIRLITAAERGPTIQSGEVDMLVRTVTWTTGRDAVWGNYAQTMLYDGQGFLVREGLGIESVLELKDATVCVTQGTTTELNLQDFSNRNNLNIVALVFEDTDAVVAAYEAEQCDAFTNDRSQLAVLSTALNDPSAHTILPETISEEPLGPVVPHGDDQWFDIVKTVMGILIYAEAYGVGQASVPSSKTGDTKVDRLFGLEGSFGQDSLGISWMAAQNVIRAVGNYGEIYARNLGPSGINLPRTDGDRNALWSAAPCSDCPKGGQIYSAPLR